MQTFSILFLNKESKLYVFVCWNQKVKVINKLPFEVCTCFVGNVKVYDNRLPAGQVILEKDVAGTYTFTLEHKQNYAVAIVGAGDGLLAERMKVVINIQVTPVQVVQLL